MSDPKVDDELAIIQAAVDRLAGMFDTVRIFVTTHESDEIGTQTITWGSGNVYAQRGQIQRWLDTQRRDDRREEDEDDDEEGE